MLAPWKKSCDKPGQHIKKQRHYFANKGLYSQCYLYGDALHHSMQIDGKTMESVTDFILGGSIITADGDFSHEIKDACFLEEKL